MYNLYVSAYAAVELLMFTPCHQVKYEGDTGKRFEEDFVILTT